MAKIKKDYGVRVCLWINPYISQQSKLFQEGLDGGFFIKRKNGDVWQWDLWQPGLAVLDVTNPAACEWYVSKLEALLDMGVDAFKVSLLLSINCERPTSWLTPYDRRTLPSASRTSTSSSIRAAIPTAYTTGTASSTTGLSLSCSSVASASTRLSCLPGAEQPAASASPSTGAATARVLGRP